jgi:hypothetical protein
MSVEPDFVCLMFLMMRNEWQYRNVKCQVLSCFYSCNLMVIINKMFKECIIKLVQIIKDSILACPIMVVIFGFQSVTWFYVCSL